MRPLPLFRPTVVADALCGPGDRPGALALRYNPQSVRSMRITSLIIGPSHR